MESPTPTAPGSTTMLWAGRILGGLVVLFMLFDGVIKVMHLPAAVEGTVRVGYPARLVVPIGVVVLACTILYAVPRTSILGAILLTGYLGGATATQVRMEDPWFLFPVAIGGLVWAAIFLRDKQLRALVPLRR
jgi:DoxX-like family